MKVHGFSDSTLCVVSRIQILPTHGQNNWMKLGTNTDLTSRSTWQPEKVQFFWHGHVDASAHTIDIEKHIQTYLIERNPESFEDRIMIMSMANDI